MIVQCEDFTYPSSSNGSALHALIVSPPTEHVRAVLQIAHGMAEHIGRYEEFGRYLAAHGIVLCGNDHPGHGRSAQASDYGFFADIDGWRHAIHDVHALRTHMQKRFEAVPYVLMGHSMGSFMAREYVTQYASGLHGLILSGTGGPHPLSGIGRLLSRIEKVRLGPKGRSTFLDQVAFGGNNKAFSPARTSADWLTRDTAMVDAYVADAACGFIFTTTGYIDFLDAHARVNQPAWGHAVPKDLPIFIISGDMDPVGDFGKGVRKVEALLKNAGHQNTTLKLYPDARHELTNEINREEVFADIITWLENTAL